MTLLHALAVSAASVCLRAVVAAAAVLLGVPAARVALQALGG